MPRADRMLITEAYAPRTLPLAMYTPAERTAPTRRATGTARALRLVCVVLTALAVLAMASHALAHPETPLPDAERDPPGAIGSRGNWLAARAARTTAAMIVALMAMLCTPALCVLCMAMAEHAVPVLCPEAGRHPEVA